MINNESWTWQMATMLWIIATYMSEKTADRYKRLIDKMSK
jgi:hypothetical protein